MQSRRKTLLTYLFICCLPLLLISLISFFGNHRFQKNLIETELDRELTATSSAFEQSLHDRETELQELARGNDLRKYVAAASARAPQDNNVAKTVAVSLSQTTAGEKEAGVRVLLAKPLRYGNHFARIAGFSPDKQLLFVAQCARTQGSCEIEFRTRDLLAERIQPHQNVWTSTSDEPLCAVVTEPTLGKILRCTTLVLAPDEHSHGALVADLKLDSLIAADAHRWVRSSHAGNGTPAVIVVALDDSGAIVYHTNDALKHQKVNNSMPYFGAVATSMTAGERGMQSFSDTNGGQWFAAYAPLVPTNLSLAVARNYSLASRQARLYGWLGIAVALLMGIAAAVFLTNYSLRSAKSIDRVAAGVGEIAKGKLDHRIELLSSDDLRPLADNVGLVTKQLREQLARETEGRQFQSFLRLSAVLTHDLKNAIEALSLIVNNMERHFEKEEFRADAMQSLTAATDKLRALVTRLSNPINTLSGEHKRPRPVDLIPILKRVIAMTAGPASTQHEVKLELPDSLMALVDGDRIDRVLENLIINALEAMTDKPGTLTIAAGHTDSGKVFFSVTDTGDGMSERFIEQKLFHPFATTKRKGVGLGLYTCREVVTANGGTIEVESRQGAGTTFKVVLPSAPIGTR